MSNDKDYSTGSPFYLEHWYVEPGSGRIQFQDTEVKLEPKVMAVLLCLVEKHGKVISRDELEATVWAGTVVGYDSLASTIIKLRKAFGDDSRNPRFIETVPKKGYRLIAKVSPAETPPADVKSMEPAPELNTNPPITGKVPNKKILALVSGLVVLLLAVVVLGVFQNPEKPTGQTDTITKADNPSVAVLPFLNMSNDPEQDYFSDGMTMDLITDLSKVSSLSVIARNTVFTYKNTDIDVRKVGKELGVRYIIEGSVRRVSDQVRISARLIDAVSGYNLWADRFDGSLSNVFDLQDKVTAEIVSSLKVTLTPNERVQLARKYTNSIEAYDQFLHGWQFFWEFSKEGITQARVHYLKAIELDEKFARAYANVALTHTYELFNSWSQDRQHSLAQAEEYIDKAIQLDAALPNVYWVQGFTAVVQRDYPKALTAVEKLLSIIPNDADAYGLLGVALNYAGKSGEALPQMLKAMELNPRHPFVYKIMLGEIYFNLHDYENAILNFTQALQRNPVAEEPRIWLAAAYAHINRLDEAAWQLENVRNSNPDFTIDKFEHNIPLKDPQQIKHLIDGLYKARGARDQVSQIN